MAIIKNIFSNTFIIWIFLSVSVLNIHNVASATGNIAPKVIIAERINEVPLKIDGKLNEPIWRKTVFISDFLQKDPNEGDSPTDSTKVTILYDNKAIYIGARMYSKNPRHIRKILNRRDHYGDTEQLSVAFDTYFDHRTAYGFGITASGVEFDRYYPEDTEWEQDYSFDPVWEAATSIDSLGWTAEMKIPFSQLRFNKKSEQVWGININRWIPTNNEDDYWVIVPKDSTGWASRFGILKGIRDIKPSRRLELLPYVAGEGKFISDYSPNNPFENGSDLSARVGGNLKMGLGPNLTLDATINPDFGQVEADPAEINLSAYETYFSERRPFFIEGNQLLSSTDFFYSRRIGASPHGTAEGDFVDIPENTTILGAAKISGRLSSGLSIASISALTNKEYADTYDISTDTKGKTEVEPLSFYHATKFQQEFGDNGSTMGALITAVERDIPSNSPLSDILRKRAYTGNTEFDLRFGEGDYNLSGLLGFSYIEGSKNAILKTKQSSAHYFQRPDADYIEIDSNRTSLSGYKIELDFNKNSGKHWLWGTEFMAESPGLDLNDIGILRSADDIRFTTQVRYRENTPGNVFQHYNLSFFISSGWDFGLIRQFTGFGVHNEFTFHNFWRTWVEIGLNTRSLNDDKTRGGPLTKNPLRGWFNVGFHNNFASNTQYGAFFAISKNELGGVFNAINFDLSSRIGNHLQLSLYPNYSYSVSKRQYVTTLNDGPAETFGKRYIFSSLEMNQLSLECRINYFFTPKLSFEAYFEPFIGAGHYYDFGELPEPRSMDLRIYGTGGTTIVKESDGSYTVSEGGDTFSIYNPDFSYLSFRSNMVLRWEFRPGSILYLVWQQNREGENTPGELIRPKDIFDTIRASGDNFIAIKLNYWIPIS